jgi:hypothetical protein
MFMLVKVQHMPSAQDLPTTRFDIQHPSNTNARCLDCQVVNLVAFVEQVPLLYASSATLLAPCQASSQWVAQIVEMHKMTASTALHRMSNSGSEHNAALTSSEYDGDRQSACAELYRYANLTRATRRAIRRKQYGQLAILTLCIYLCAMLPSYQVQAWSTQLRVHSLRRRYYTACDVQGTTISLRQNACPVLTIPTTYKKQRRVARLRRLGLYATIEPTSQSDPDNLIKTYATSFRAVDSSQPSQSTDASLRTDSASDAIESATNHASPTTRHSTKSITPASSSSTLLATVSSLTWSDVLTNLPAIIASLTLSCLVALACITWEDYGIARLVGPPSQAWRITANRELSLNSPHWGQSTVMRLGFGQRDREYQVAQEADVDPDLKSNVAGQIRAYNEVMLDHRSSRVAKWHQSHLGGMSGSTLLGELQIPHSVQSVASTSQPSEQRTLPSPADAYHVVCQCMQSLSSLRSLTDQYQWSSIRQVIHSSPWTDLEYASMTLRQFDPTHEVVGFDWGSCAYRRQCGALADATEALDQIDALLGILEPYEVVFCLDIVERSLRDMLTLNVPRTDADQVYVHSLPVYQPHRVFAPFDPKTQYPGNMDADEDAGEWRMDDAYMQALRDLRIDDDDETDDKGADSNVE